MAPEDNKEIFLGENRVQGAEIDFVDLRLELTSKKKAKKSRLIMDNLSGKIFPGRFTALMGPSGSGKTSLLNALAGRTRGTKHLHLTGEILCDGLQVTDWSAFRRTCAYVEQDDLLFSMLTVRETIQFAANMRLPRTMTQEEKNNRVELVLAELALKNCAETRIGDAEVRGISGGERKRTSMAIEILRGPAVLFVDEATTGVDSFQALRIATTIKELAMGGRTCVSSLHQPRSSIFQLLDYIIILAEGKMVYSGSARMMIDYFESIGFPMPMGYNPSDFVLDLASVDTKSEGSGDVDTKQRVAELIQKFHPLSDSHEVELTEDEMASVRQAHEEIAKVRYQATFTTQLGLLLQRAARQKMRYTLPLKIGFASNLFFALLVGFLFFQTGKDLSQKTIQDKVGLFFFIVLNQFMTGLFSVLAVFPGEKSIIHRERAGKAYALLPYYISKLVIELTMLINPTVFVVIVYFISGLQANAGTFFATLWLCWVGYLLAQSIGLLAGSFSDSQMGAQTRVMPILLLFIVTSGFYINLSTIAVWIAWFTWVSPFRYLLSAMLVLHFTGVVFECMPEEQAANACIPTGEAFIQRLGVEGDTYGRSVGVVLGMLVFVHILAYLSLRVRRAKWLVPVPNNSTSTQV